MEAAISWTLHQAQGSQVPAQRPGSREAAAGSEHIREVWVAPCVCT